MAKTEDRVIAFSLTGKWATLASGPTVPITNMFDMGRLDTDDPDLCWTFVCGSTETKWFACCVGDYEEARTN